MIFHIIIQNFPSNMRFIFMYIPLFPFLHLKQNMCIIHSNTTSLSAQIFFQTHLQFSLQDMICFLKQTSILIKDPFPKNFERTVGITVSAFFLTWIYQSLVCVVWYPFTITSICLCHCFYVWYTLYLTTITFVCLFLYLCNYLYLYNYLCNFL